MRVAYAGTPPFAVPALQALARAGHDVVLVLTQPDRPAGRGMQVRASAVAEAAAALALPVAKPASLKQPEAQALLADAKPDVLVVAAYGQILPPAVLAIPRLGCLNIHASLLPRWRGAAPVHRAILAGDPETGVCIMRMEAGLDTGPVLRVVKTPIVADDTTGSLTARLAALGADAVVACLAAPLPWREEPQDAALATYAAKVAKAEARIDWTRSAVELDRLIRAFNPAPGAEGIVDGEPLKIWQARAVSAPVGRAGESHDLGAGRLAICCGQGALELLEVQRPGARRTPIGDYCRGRAAASR